MRVCYILFFPFLLLRIYIVIILFLGLSKVLVLGASFFFTFTPRPLILTIQARSLCESLFFLIKYISAYLLDINCVLCLLAHIMHRLYAAISFLQLSASLPPQATKLGLLINLKLSVLFLIFLKYFSSSDIKKKKRIEYNSNFCGIPINI